MKPSASYWIEKLSLSKHPEGGAYKEVYRSSLTIQTENLFSKERHERNVCTGIYFLLQENEFSSFHRLASDEQWHFYFGNSMVVFEIEALTGELIEHKLGNDHDNGSVFQTTVKAGNWFAAKVEGAGYALVGCTVAPGFDFADFELAERKKLIKAYPQHKALIDGLIK
jgi:predicted cupin superfamily sugar epimerase